jgi:hypothetical protein
MNRLKKAWLALTDRLEPEVVTRTTIYLPEPAMWRNYFRAATYEQGWMEPPTIEYFHTCEQAHQARPGASVTVVLGFEVEGRTFIAPGELKPIEVEPKPKRLKGRA